MTAGLSETPQALESPRLDGDVPVQPVLLACGHEAESEQVVVIRPSGKLKFDCPSGCGLQPAA
jgi:hypothetical protein